MTDPKPAAPATRIRAVDHLAISVSDFEVSKAFYGDLFGFLGMPVFEDHDGAMGWKNDVSRFWIMQADGKGRKHVHRKGDVGFHHYAFTLASKQDVYDLEAFLEEKGYAIDDKADEYYPKYWAVYFLDPDGMKFEGAYWEE